MSWFARNQIDDSKSIGGCIQCDRTAYPFTDLPTRDDRQPRWVLLTFQGVISLESAPGHVFSRKERRE
ncbi:MAG TPA: hypothetical protein DDY91_03970 [Planctomycetaceae bacterium]|nr:hypothetical protein [Planctomycetaceae bacterium]